MKTLLIFILFFLNILSSAVFAQNKKEVKKLKIKSTTIVVTEYADSKEKSRTDSYQKFDKSGNVIEELEYNNDGTFKKREAHKFNKDNDVIEEIIYDEKGNIKSKKTIEYNVNKDKKVENEYDVTGKLVAKTQYGYTPNGFKSYEITTDDKGKNDQKIHLCLR